MRAWARRAFAAIQRAICGLLAWAGLDGAGRSNRRLRADLAILGRDLAESRDLLATERRVWTRERAGWAEERRDLATELSRVESTLTVRDVECKQWLAVIGRQQAIIERDTQIACMAAEAAKQKTPARGRTHLRED